MGVTDTVTGLGGSAAGAEDEHAGQALEWRYVLCLIAGMLSPLLFAWRHAPAHEG